MRFSTALIGRILGDSFRNGSEELLELEQVRSRDRLVEKVGAYLDSVRSSSFENLLTRFFLVFFLFGQLLSITSLREVNEYSDRNKF